MYHNKISNLNCRIIASILLVMLSLCSKAQNVGVRIDVKNDKNEPVQNATAQILRTKDSSILSVKTLKNNAFFSVPSNTAYFLRLTAVGIVPVFQNIEIGNADTTLTIIANTKAKNLDAVVVTSTKQFIKQEDDKTIVDAEPIANSSTNALEVLEKTPGAIVDQDGNVYLNSATPATIYINGRELKLSAADISSLLKSLPANSVSKIEILRSPSAKFDAASSGGIVNIVLKKGVKLGTNGSIDASYFQGVYATETIGFSVNKSQNKLNTYLSYNFTNRESFFVLNSEQPLSLINVLRVQQSYTKFKATTNYASAGFDYAINNKWNIALDTRFTANNNRGNVKNDINLLTLNRQSQIGNNVSLVSNIGPTYFLGNTFSTKYKVDSLGSEWTNSLDYSYYKNDNEQLYQNVNIIPQKNTLFGDGDILNKKNIVAFKSDLVLKTKSKVTIEAGTKINYSASNNNALYFADSSTGKYLNNYQTNAFKYEENIAALYLQVSKTFSGFTIKPGVRLEHTDITGNQLVPTPNTFKIKRTDVFPYIYLRHGLGKVIGFKLTGNLIFRRSITRPYYEALNPFPKFVDQYTYDIGNPNLRPQITNNYEFNVNANEFPIFSVGLNDIQDIFTTLTNARADTLFRTWDNLGKNKEVYMRLVAGIPPGKKYFFYLGTQMNMINYDGFYNGEIFKYKRASWNIFTFHSYKATPTLNISLQGFMRINGVFNFFETSTFGSLNLSANKSILKKKMNIILSVNDALLSNRFNFNVDVPKFIGSGNQYADSRRIGIAIKYNFGLKPKPERTPAFGAPVDAN
jgi:iron complex outermembrane recepter protein